MLFFFFFFVFSFSYDTPHLLHYCFVHKICKLNGQPITSLHPIPFCSSFSVQFIQFVFSVIVMWWGGVSNTLYESAWGNFNFFPNVNLYCVRNSIHHHNVITDTWASDLRLCFRTGELNALNWNEKYEYIEFNNIVERRRRKITQMKLNDANFCSFSNSSIKKKRWKGTKKDVHRNQKNSVNHTKKNYKFPWLKSNRKFS